VLPWPIASSTDHQIDPSRGRIGLSQQRCLKPARRIADYQGQSDGGSEDRASRPQMPSASRSRPPDEHALSVAVSAGLVNSTTTHAPSWSRWQKNAGASDCSTPPCRQRYSGFPLVKLFPPAASIDLASREALVEADPAAALEVTHTSPTSLLLARFDANLMCKGATRRSGWSCAHRRFMPCSNAAGNGASGLSAERLHGRPWLRCRLPYLSLPVATARIFRGQLSGHPAAVKRCGRPPTGHWLSMAAALALWTG